MRRVKYLLDFDDGDDFHRFSSLADVKQFLCDGDFSPGFSFRLYIKASNPWDCFNALSGEFSVRSFFAKSACGVLNSCRHWCVVDKEAFNA